MRSDTSDQRTYTSALLGLVWSAMFGFSAFFFSYSTMVTIATANGLSTVTGGSVLTTMMLGVIVVQPFAPWAGRVFGFKGALMCALVLQFIGQLLRLFVTPALLALVLAGLCGGIGFGLFVVLANAAVPGTTSAGRIGKALGFFGGITTLAAAVGAPLGLWRVETIPIWIFRLIVCACPLVAIPTVLKFVPGRSRAGTDSTADTGSGHADGRIRAGRNARRGRRGAGGGAGARVRRSARGRARAGRGATAATGAGRAAVGGRSGGDERRGLRWAGRRAGEVLGLVLMLSPFVVGVIVFGVIIGFGRGDDVA